MKEKEKFKNTLLELNELLIRYGRGTMRNQISIISSLIEDIDNASLDELQSVAKGLFTPKSGLSEFNVWKDDFKERTIINSKIDEARTELWKLVKDSR